MLVIGLGHEARQGKDSLAQQLIEFYSPYKICMVRVAFADELKREVGARLNWYRAQGTLTTDSLQEAMKVMCHESGVVYDPSPDMSDPLCPYGKQRALLQWWGTEYRRHKDADYWVRKVLQRIARLAEQGVRASIITDCRFPNELAAIKRHQGITINVNRVGYTNDQATSSHASERSLTASDYDEHIFANGLDDLFLKGLAAVHSTVVRGL